MRLSLISSQERRDPYLKIPLSDWYELLAKLRGRYIGMVWCVERRKVDGAWRVENTDTFALESKYFALYDSHSLPVRGGVKVTDVRREWEKRGWLSLVRWFVQRNLGTLVLRLGIAAFMVWILCFGGLQQCVGCGMSGVTRSVSKWMMGSAKVQQAHLAQSQKQSGAVVPPSAVGVVLAPATQAVASVAEAKAVANVVDDVEPPVVLIACGDTWALGSDGVARSVGDAVG